LLKIIRNIIMMTRLQRKAMNRFLSIAAILFCVAFNVYACQNKRPPKKMSEKISDQLPADTDRLLTVANLEETDSGRKVIAWFFETPRVFEFNLDSGQSQQFFKILKEAKEKQLPVNVLSIVKGGKNIIALVTSATKDQINRYNQERAKRQQPVRVPPPANN